MSQGSGGSQAAKERHIDDLQEGFSILREGREVCGVRFLIGRQLKQGRRKVKLGLLKKSIVGGDVKSISELNSTHHLKLKILSEGPNPSQNVIRYQRTD